MLHLADREFIARHISSDALMEVGLHNTVAMLYDVLPEEFRDFWEQRFHWENQDLVYCYNAAYVFGNQRLLEFCQNRLLAYLNRLTGSDLISFCLEYRVINNSDFDRIQSDLLAREIEKLLTSNNEQQLLAIFNLKHWTNYSKARQYRTDLLRSIICNRANNLNRQDLEFLFWLGKQAAELGLLEGIEASWLRDCFLRGIMNFEDAANYWLVLHGLEKPSPKWNFGNLFSYGGSIDKQFIGMVLEAMMSDSFADFAVAAKKCPGGCTSLFLAQRLPFHLSFTHQLWDLQCELAEQIDVSKDSWPAYQLWCHILCDSYPDSQTENKAFSYLSNHPPRNWYDLRWLLRLRDCHKPFVRELFFRQLKEFTSKFIKEGEEQGT